MKETYKSQRAVILREFGDLENEDDVIRFVEWINGSNVGSGTKKNRRSAAIDMWWNSHEWNKENYANLYFNMEKINTGKQAKYVKELINEQKYIKLLSACRSNKQRLFMKFLWETGLRISEMQGIKLSDCHTCQDKIEISITAKKTNKPIQRLIPIDLFRAIRKEFHGKQFLFETSTGHPYSPGYVTHQISKIGATIKIDVSSHSFRHSWLTRKAEAGENIINISRQMGHKTAGSTINSYYIGAVQ
jgi:integrase